MESQAQQYYSLRVSFRTSGKIPTLKVKYPAQEVSETFGKCFNFPWGANETFR